MTTCHRIIIALGTNAGKEKLSKACKMLKENFHDARFSRITPTEPLGNNFKGTQFHNAICMCTTTMDAPTLAKYLKSMECSAGDSRQLRQEGKVILDLDLLKYDDEQHHVEDWERQYIKELMSDILATS